MTERPDTPDTRPDAPEGKTGQTSSRRMTSVATRTRQRPQFESRRIRRVPTAPEIPWYNNWRLLLPIVAVVILGIVMLGFALGQAGSRQATQPVAPAPVIQVTAGAGQSIPVEVVTSTPAPR